MGIALSYPLYINQPWVQSCLIPYYVSNLVLSPLYQLIMGSVHISPSSAYNPAAGSQTLLARSETPLTGPQILELDHAMPLGDWLEVLMSPV